MKRKDLSPSKEGTSSIDGLSEMVQQKLSFESECIKQLHLNTSHKTRLQNEQTEIESLKSFITSPPTAEQKNALLAEYQAMQEPANQIKINVGGSVFVTTQQTIHKEDSMLKVMLSSQFHVERAADGSILIERDPKHFPVILRHLRHGGAIHNIGIPSDLRGRNELLEEAQFYGLGKLVEHLTKLNAAALDGEGETESTDAEAEADADSQMQESTYTTVDSFAPTPESVAQLWDTIKETSEQCDAKLKEFFQKQQQELEAKRIQFEQERATAIKAYPHKTIKFNIGGVLFSIGVDAILKHPSSLFPKLIGAIITEQNDTVFLDRDPDLFKHVVEFLHTESVSQELLSKVDLRVGVLREAKHFYLKALIDKLNPLRYPLELIGEDNIKMKEEEDIIRNLFATNREHPLLEHTYLMLLPVFKMREQFNRANQPKLASLPLLFNFEHLAQTGYLKHLIPAFQPVKLVKTIDEFCHQFHVFTSGLLTGLNWDNVFVAGGSVLACLTKDNFTTSTNVPTNVVQTILGDKAEQPPLPPFKDYISNMPKYAERNEKLYGNGYEDSDLDIFLYGLSAAEAENKVRSIYETLKSNSKDVFILRTKNAITFKCSKHNSVHTRSIQIILRIYKSPAEVLMGFDIDSCTVGFDGREVWALPRARRAITERINLVDVDRQSKNYELRLFKYAKRGFRVCVPGFDRNLVQKQDLIKNFQFAFYRRFKLIQSTYHNCTGLARLLILEKSLKSVMPSFKSQQGVYTTYNKAQEFYMHGHSFSGVSDYCNFYLALRHSPLRCIRQFNTAVEALQRKHGGQKPDIVFTLNNIDAVLNASADRTSLSSTIEWLTVNPGTQHIGSFNPTKRNFYRDAYSAAEPAGRVQWYYIAGRRMIPYDSASNEMLEAAYLNTRDYEITVPHNNHRVSFSYMCAFTQSHSLRVRRTVVQE